MLFLIHPQVRIYNYLKKNYLPYPCLVNGECIQIKDIFAQHWFQVVLGGYQGQSENQQGFRV